MRFSSKSFAIGLTFASSTLALSLATAVRAQQALPGIDVFGERTAPSAAAEGGAAASDRNRIAPSAITRGSAEGSAASGYRNSTATTSLFGQRSLQDTPYSINVVSNDFIQNTQANSAQDALKYVPSIYEGAASNMVGGGSTFTIRGFSTDTNESYVDGLHLLSSSPIEDKERIEVINGPASFIYGFGNPAGVVNYLTKRPTDKPYYSLTAGDAGGAQGYAHVDAGGPIDDEGRFGYRINLLQQGRSDTVISGQRHERFVASGALDWRVVQGTTVMVDYGHYYFDIRGGDNLFTIGSALKSLPTAPNAAQNFMPAYARSYDEVNRAAIRLNSELGDMFALRAAFAFNDVDMFRNRPRDQITNSLGNYTMSRNYYRTNKKGYEGYVYGDVKFDLVGLRHTVTLGLTDEDDRFRYAYPFSNQTVSYGGTGNIYLPTAYPADKPGAPIGYPDKTTEHTGLLTSSLVDTIAINDQWTAIGGVTLAKIDDQNWDYSTYPTSGKVTQSVEYSRSVATPTVGLTYKPWSNVSLYGSYIESLQKGPTAPTTAANANQTLAPFLAEQTEFGAKTSWGGLDVNAAFFRIKKANAYTNTATKIYSEDGREVHDGVELIATGKALPELTITGGVTFMHARVTKSDTVGVDGRVPVAVPERMARFYGEYALPICRDLFVSAGLVYNGKVYADALNTLILPQATTLDLGVRYETKLYEHPATLRFNATNVTGLNYWTISSSNLTLGAPRSFAFSAQFIF